MGILVLLCLHQTLGIVHAVAHGHSHPQQHAHADAVPAAALHHEHGDDGFLSLLFGDHEEGSSDCRLFDQSSPSCALVSVPFVVLPIALAPVQFLVFIGHELAVWRAPFQARGPPFFR